jgi:DNA-directed RNA polymerase specialized sigma24 family protein
MQASENRATTPVETSPELVRAAFRDLHGSRLHGFALLVTLGDRARAARLAGEAIAAGMARTSELRHPERAAAWLRRRVTRNAERRGRGARGPAEGRVALEELGVDGATFAGLTVLSTRDRAALVADSIERLERGDVATILGVDGARLDRLIRRVRRRYAETVAAALDDEAALNGPTARQVQAIAARALG